MSKLFIYVIDRDFGFAPNPFHGLCTLATCKPKIRKGANVGDWIIGMGGRRLKSTGKCIYSMNVTEKISFNEYWNNPKYRDKKPIRNGSKRMVVGDNIYCYDEIEKSWEQADSHHSNPDGSINQSNLKNDTQTDSVLIANKFYYFGSAAPVIPKTILNKLGYFNKVAHWVFHLEKGIELIDWIQNNFSNWLNLVMAKPFDFESSHSKYSAETNKIMH